MHIGFDNDKYTAMQSERIRQRIDIFGGKLYMEFGGSSLTTITLPGCFPAFCPTARCGCC